jgi:hypothetical protein
MLNLYFIFCFLPGDDQPLSQLFSKYCLLKDDIILILFQVKFKSKHSFKIQ